MNGIPANNITQNRLSPEARLDLIAEILAQAVRRSLLRRGRCDTQGTGPVFNAKRSREQLAYHTTKSVHGVRTRPRKETR